MKKEKTYTLSWGETITIKENETIKDVLYEMFCATCPNAAICHSRCCEFEDPYVCDSYYEVQDILEETGEEL